MTNHHFVARNSRQRPRGVEGGKMIGRGRGVQEAVLAVHDLTLSV